MIRLFVAVVPPVAVRDQLLDLMGGVTGARWQRDDQLHLTLRFIGEVDRHTANDIAAALAGVHHPAFDVAVGGFGIFEARGRAKALWAGVAPAAEVATLHKKVDQALVRAGILPESRAFHPHITLARLNRGSGPVAGFLAANVVAPIACRIDEFQLIESVMTGEGSEYFMVERYALGDLS